jgi:manganese peroxidase
MGIASCPGGPTITVLVGRTSTSTANPSGQMPSGNDNATTLIADFAAKGFSVAELVALVGAHTAAKNLSDVVMDTTVGDWDNTFYGETQNGTAPSSLNSDLSLANDDTDSSSVWTQYAQSASAWQAAFVPA